MRKTGATKSHEITRKFVLLRAVSCLFVVSSLLVFAANASFFQQPSEIIGEIKKIEYKLLLAKKLREIPKQNFNVNTAPTAFILTGGGKNKIAVSRWVSPKRTRSYPYERVYNTLSHPGKKATVIPVLKDEGASGDRDFIQWDTISLMSLLDVYVIPAYYNDATRAGGGGGGKITDQKFDNEFVLAKIAEIENFKATALEWNLKQLREIAPLLEKAKTAYREIAKKTGVALHGESGVDQFARRIKGNVEEFMRLSRLKAQEAQSREFVTLQPKESLASDTKGRVTITDGFGGKYFFTCDETSKRGKTIHLIEAKHSRRAKMPNETDIKDGLLKMMLYANLQNVRVGGEKFDHKPVLRLTSAKLQGAISSESKPEDFENFCKTNLLSPEQKEFLRTLFNEARQNRFSVRLESVAQMTAGNSEIVPKV